MGQERKNIPKSPGGHGRQPARRRHPERVHRLLPMVHVPAGKHRLRRRTRHGMPGQRDVPLQGESRRRRRAAVVLQGGIRQGILRNRRHRFDGGILIL